MREFLEVRRAGSTCWGLRFARMRKRLLGLGLEKFPVDPQLMSPRLVKMLGERR